MKGTKPNLLLILGAASVICLLFIGAVKLGMMINPSPAPIGEPMDEDTFEGGGDEPSPSISQQELESWHDPIPSEIDRIKGVWTCITIAGVLDFFMQNEALWCKEQIALDSSSYFLTEVKWENGSPFYHFRRICRWDEAFLGGGKYERISRQEDDIYYDFLPENPSVLRYKYKIRTTVKPPEKGGGVVSKDKVDGPILFRRP